MNPSPTVCEPGMGHKMFAFLTRCQVMLILLAWVPHSETLRLMVGVGVRVGSDPR